MVVVAVAKSGSVTANPRNPLPDLNQRLKIGVALGSEWQIFLVASIAKD